MMNGYVSKDSSEGTAADDNDGDIDVCMCVLAGHPDQRLCLQHHQERLALQGT